MKRCFIDTNLLIRYLTNDDPAKADRVDKLLQQAPSGKVRLVTAEMVLAEAVWVLESNYNLKPGDIAPMISAILATPGLEVTNAALVARALKHYRDDQIDFVDGYIAALMEKLGIQRIYSFDKKHMSRIKGLQRIEP
jgi:predicted nucleic-acid-binding protein